MKINANTILILIGLAILAYLIWMRPAPPSVTTVYRDTSRTPAVVITMPQPTIQIPGPAQGPQINVNGLDSATLRTMLVDLLEQHRRLYAEHSTYRQYDTVLADSNAVESLSVAVQHNQLQRLTRKLDVINTRTIEQAAAPWIYAGVYALADSSGIPSFGPTISVALRSGAVIRAGKSLQGNQFMLGADFPILKKKWKHRARDTAD